MRYTVALVVCLMASPAHADIAGLAVVGDDATLRVGQTVIHLQGIKLPDPGQRCRDTQGQIFACGKQAVSWMQVHLGGQQILCLGQKTGRDGRLRATCFKAALNLNGAMVSAGWATAHGRASDRYDGLQRAAEAARRGLHRGTLINP